MQRCLELAATAAGHVAPNPMVGAVLVHNNRIIGEGYHRQYGGPHAEVECVRSVKEADQHLISQSVLYVSLEPCAHFGKTPPCADLIIAQQIPQVVVGCRDPFKQVDGKGIEKLQAAGVAVTLGVLEQACLSLNKRFITFNTAHRPWIVLKWAQTANGKIAAAPGANRLLISNDLTNRLVHQWRSEEAAILVGTNTALIDNPSLTNRLWSGPSPIRLVVDMDLRLHTTLQLFNREVRTIVFNSRLQEERENVLYYQLTKAENLVPQIVHALYQLKIQSVLVEGGAKLLQSFIDAGLWDEARVITNQELVVPDGLAAPRLQTGQLREHTSLLSDTLQYFVNPQAQVL